MGSVIHEKTSFVTAWFRRACQAGIESIKNQMSSEQRQLRSVFCLFDDAGTGLVSASLLKNTLLSAAQKHPEHAGDPRQYYHSVVALDKLGDKQITFEEFADVFAAGSFNLSSGKTISKQDAFKLFRLLDVDDKGKIGYPELKGLMEDLGEIISPEELQEMIYRADMNGDGLVDAEEFYRVLSCTHHFAENS
ncbi:centrin [Gregarina niphandrodes]|uniref:Centrin n=1 Tax=Gregarina niphandrodes TaxID=110365 RepID=A0A023AZL0_GRENI|nr:centrin [Gregarina niphandrodes]EZG44178.1 centrin [Gregarina niphandrodes]|eukprot:XP_011132776.1 centrin [Gregarina niphandrodes]